MITVDPWLVDVSGCTVVVAPDVVATVLSDVPVYHISKSDVHTNCLLVVPSFSCYAPVCNVFRQTLEALRHKLLTYNSPQPSASNNVNEMNELK